MNKFAKLVLDNAKERWGRGWDLLTKDMQEAFIAKAALDVLMAQDEYLTKFDPAKELISKAMEAFQA